MHASKKPAAALTCFSEIMCRDYVEVMLVLSKVYSRQAVSCCVLVLCSVLLQYYNVCRKTFELIIVCADTR